MSTEFSTTFVPKENVSRTFGKQTVSVYPEIQPTMTHAEKSYAFMVTKSALEATTIPVDQKLQILAGITRTGPLVGVLQAKFIAIANTALSKVGNFSVLSYHSRNGVTIAATLPNGDLRPTQNATAAARRPAGVMFARLACDLRFTEIDVDNTITHPFTYFVRLPNDDQEITTSTGTILQLDTFHGRDDWATGILDQATLDTILKSNQAFGNPFTLLPSSISDPLSSAVLESTEPNLRKIALLAAWPSVCRAVFKQLCPNLDRDPIAVIQSIHQVSKDDKGVEVQQTVVQYFNSLQCMTNFLPSDQDWSIDITQHFWTHLLSNIRVQMQANGYVHNSAASLRDPFSQLMSLQEAFAAATVAEDTLTRFQRIARDTVQSSLTLATNVNNAWVGNSVAEDTMSKYDKDNNIVKKTRGPCWGCGGTDHSFANRKVITCPNKDKPGVMEKATKARKDFNEKLSARKKARAKRDTEGGTGGGFLSKLSGAQIQALSADQLRSLISDSNESPTKKPKSDIHTFSVMVLEASTGSAMPRIPITVESNLPHISLPIGHDPQTKFSLSVAYDTCAACNVGFAGHHLPIAERYPQLVKSLTYTANKYTPLTLSGIVHGDSKKSSEQPSAILPIVIEYWMPFLTKEGHKTTLKIALGNEVSVNTIIGMPMIRPAKLSFDLVDNVVESGILDTEPFPVIYRPTIQSSPDFSQVSSDDPKLFKSMIDYDHVTSAEVKACTLAMTTDIATSDFAKPISDKSKLDDVEIAEEQLPELKSPISVPKQKWRPKTASIWEEEENDDHEHPDYDSNFQRKTGNSLRKSSESALALAPPNLSFNYVYCPDKDSAELEANLVLDKDMSPDLKNRIKSFVQEFWDVFREEGVKVPIRGYEMVIDTGKHRPIVCRQPHYGLHETPIMQKTIVKLLGLGFIKPDSTSPWGARITLAPKPHQEKVTEMEKYVWRFCINYIRLNMVTRPAEYPIPRCDDAVMYGFGEATFFILLDASSGYHQMKLSEASMLKTAFFAPHGRKYCWVVMPFGLKNAPPAFVAMMHDLKEMWTAVAEAHGIDTSVDNGTTIIIDDNFIYGVSIEHTFLMTRCVCLIARKYQLTWKLKKSQWIPSKVEFVGVDIHKEGGNTPAESKDIILTNWNVPTTPRHVMGFIGFAIFYLRWCPWFEMKIKPLRESISDHTLDHPFTASEFGSAAVQSFHYIRDYILSKPILQRANIKKRFYLKTDFSALGLGFALCQPDDSAQSIAAMNREDSGGDCEFEFCVSKMRLLPVAFGSRKTRGNEVHFHSHPGESLAASWGTTKNRHFLWGRPFTLMTDCRALIWLMDYKGHNHAVRRLQLEMLGYTFTIANRPGAMLEDANYFSRLGADIHVDPLLKDYLAIARQAYINNPPSAEPLGDQNMPGRRSKRRKIEEEPVTELNLANVEWNQDSIDLTPTSNKLARQYSNVPVHICETQCVQQPSKKHFSYITETAVRLSTLKWALSQPGHGHFIEAGNSASIKFEPVIVCDTDQNCRNTMQTRFSTPFIFESIHKMASFCDTNDLPFIQGYYVHLDSRKDDAHTIQELKIHEQIISSLRKKANLEMIVIQLSYNLPTKAYAALRNRLAANGWYLHERKLNSSKHFSDRIFTEFDLIIGLSSNYYQSNDQTAFDLLSPTPAVPNGMSPKILVEFNDPQYALPYIGDLFTVTSASSVASREPTVKYIIRQNEADLHPKLDLGYQVYHQDSPAPLPSSNISGLFGNLFGISFNNEKYTADNQETKELIRAIAAAEYTSLFGYDPNYSTYLNGQPDVTQVLRRTLPYKTAARLADTTSQILESSINLRCNEASSTNGVDLSVPALFNGIIADKMPDESAWADAYSHDVCCATIIKMIMNPSRISNEELGKIHSVYRAPIRQSQMKWENERLLLYEPIAHSTKTVRLTVVPNDLRKHIFTSFHANPIGGHLSLYYTLHRIRLRYHWPGMYTYVKQNIDDCVACVLRNGGTRSSSEFLYGFPISAPFMTVHADAWVPGKTMSFDGNIGLMIVVCHMTGFAAIEPLREMNSSSFARSVYTILLRYGLPQLIITDPDSKFKGNFKEAFATLKIQHYLSARGNHNAILVERFNRYLNSGLRVFNNDRETNRVFIEGAQTLTYAWNSCPVLGTDLSRSLLTVGREFHFPIDFEADRRLSFEPTDKEKKLFAENLTDLLRKSREIYLLLIAEHRAAHREYRNAQIHQPREFKVGDIVFTNVQVQSKVKTGTVTKLAYIKRGPYKIIKDYIGGSYELEPLVGRSRATIKKHGSDLYLSPQSLIPHKPVQSSDQAFGDLQKKTISNPYQLAGLDGYDAAQPWSAPAATSQVNLAILNNIPQFPTVQELDNEFDGWPESGNPFINREISTPATPIAPTADSIIALSSSMRTKSSIVADIIRSEDKLFFIAYAQERSQERKEWKLVRVDFHRSLQQHPTCLQDGRFLMDFFIEHHRDKNLDICTRRYWVEYHKNNSHKSLSLDYHIIQPSQYSENTATSMGLTPYREWVQLDDTSITLHGPFNFATLNNRKTRDRVAKADWLVLQDREAFYHNAAPKLSTRIMHVDISQPSYENIKTDHEVQSRCQSFMFNMEFNDTTLKDFGAATPLQNP